MFEDITKLVRTAEMPGPSPFDDEPIYEGVFRELARCLHRRQRRHACLVGERGVGIGSVIAEFARRAGIGRIPFLNGCRVLRTDCRFTAPEESRRRLGAILSEAAEHEDWVVCIEGFASLLRDARSGNRAFLLSCLAGVRCRLIAVTAPREHDEWFAGDADLAEFFGRVDVPEPDAGVALKLLRHFAAGLQARFELRIDDEAVRQSVVLSANYILNEQLPAKALKILHQVCEDIDYRRTQLGESVARVGVDDVVAAVSEQSGVPAETLRGIADRSDYRRSLGEVVFGQDHAVNEVAAELGLIKAGMTDRGKPASVMLFIGQTGTGKTEMAKALARFYSTSKRLRTYTLGNFVESHSVSGIIGVPPGYVGNDQGGRLINDLNSDPYGVFLLDEVDKAHPDVLQPFLNLFDEGWISDQRGVRACADKSIFILTTNIGQRMISDMAARGESIDAITEKMKETLTQIKHTKSNRPVFTPEFLARIKRIIVFGPLKRDAMQAIARKVAGGLDDEWRRRRNKRLTVDPALPERLGALAFERNEKSKGREGGRLVRKLVSEVIETAVQRAISDDPQRYRACGAVTVRPVDGSAPVPGALPVPPAVTVTFDGNGDGDGREERRA